MHGVRAAVSPQLSSTSLPLRAIVTANPAAGTTAAQSRAWAWMAKASMAASVLPTICPPAFTVIRSPAGASVVVPGTTHFPVAAMKSYFVMSQ